MLKKLSVMVVAAVLLIIAVPAMAQDDYDDIRVSVGAKAGWLFFQDDPLSESIENNWLIGGDLRVWFANGFGIGGEIQFTTDDVEGAGTEGSNIDVELDLVPIHLNAYYRFPTDNSDFVPYVGGGVSFVFADITANGYLDTGAPAVIDTDDTAIGFNVLGGLEFNRHFFVEGQWFWAETDFDKEIQVLDEDINLGGFNVMVGIRY